MLSIPGTEALSPAVKYLIAFAIIFVLLALFALVLRRLTGGRLSLPSSDRRSRQPRLGIVDVYDLDRQRQLILLRRDNVEHLLLIGGPNDVIVETNIVRTPGARLPASVIEQSERPETLIDRSLEAPPRPMVEPVQRPEPVMARLGSTEPARAGAEQTVRGGPVAVQAEPMLKPDVVAMAPAPRPVPQPMREPAPPPREPPPPMHEAPPPPPAVQRAAPFRPPPPPPPPQREPVPPPESPVMRPPEPPPRQPAPSPAPRPPDPAIADAAVLSNMARQLEDALKRPLSPGMPGNTSAPAPNGPAPQPEERPRGIPTPPSRMPQPMPTAAPVPPPIPVPPAPLSAGPAEPPEPPAPRSRPAPAPGPVSRMRPGPGPEPEPPKAPPEPAGPPPAPAVGAGQVDPFSVEEIEAEFARLLGRPLDRGDRPH